MWGQISSSIQVRGRIGITGSFGYCGDRKNIFGAWLEAADRGGRYIACEEGKKE